MSAGGEVYGVELSASAGVAITRRFLLKIVLAGGHDYRLKAMPDRPGIYWILAAVT